MSASNKVVKKFVSRRLKQREAEAEANLPELLLDLSAFHMALRDRADKIIAMSAYAKMLGEEDSEILAVIAGLIDSAGEKINLLIDSHGEEIFGEEEWEE